MLKKGNEKIKKLSIVMMLVLAVMMLGATVANAAIFTLDMGYYQKAGSYKGEDILSVSPSSSWIADVTCGSTLTTSSNGGSIIGNFASDYIWQASYSTDGGSTYTVLASLLNSSSNPPSQTISTQTFDDALLGTVINAPITNIKLAYDFELVTGSAGGTARFDLTPVPEPSGILALMAGLTGIAGVVIRRRA